MFLAISFFTLFLFSVASIFCVFFIGDAFAISGNYIVTNAENRLFTIDRDTNIASIIATDVGSRSFDVAIDPLGNYIVADYWGGNIISVTPSGVKTTLVSGLAHPYGIAIDSNSNYIVIDTGTGTGDGRILSINSNTFVVTTLLGNLTGWLYDIEIDANGDYIVIDGLSDRILKINHQDLAVSIISPNVPDGRLRALTINSNGDYVLTYSITGNVSDGSLILIDHLSGNYSVITNGLTDPSGIAFDNGNYIVTDTGTGNLLSVTPSGVKTTLVSGLGNPYGIAINYYTPNTTISSAVVTSKNFPSGSTTTATSIKFSFNSVDGANPIYFECRLDGKNYSTCNSPIQYSSLKVGTHYFDVRVVGYLSKTDPTPAHFEWAIKKVK